MVKIFLHIFIHATIKIEPNHAQNPSTSLKRLIISGQEPNKNALILLIALLTEQNQRPILPILLPPEPVPKAAPLHDAKLIPPPQNLPCLSFAQLKAKLKFQSYYKDHRFAYFEWWIR